MNEIQEPIIVEQSFANSKKEIWEAITNPIEMRKWFFPNITSFEPKMGFETNFVIKSENISFTHNWKVIEVIKNEKISYDWKYEGYSGSANSQFDISTEGKMTKLKLIFTIIEKFHNDIPEFKRESGIKGWILLIKNNLPDYLKNSK